MMVNERMEKEERINRREKIKRKKKEKGKRENIKRLSEKSENFKQIPRMK